MPTEREFRLIDADDNATMARNLAAHVSRTVDPEGYSRWEPTFNLAERKFLFLLHQNKENNELPPPPMKQRFHLFSGWSDATTFSNDRRALALIRFINTLNGLPNTTANIADRLIEWIDSKRLNITFDDFMTDRGSWVSNRNLMRLVFLTPRTVDIDASTYPFLPSTVGPCYFEFALTDAPVWIPQFVEVYRRKARKWGRSLTERWEDEHTQLVNFRKFKRNAAKVEADSMALRKPKGPKRKARTTKMELSLLNSILNQGEASAKRAALSAAKAAKTATRKHAEKRGAKRVVTALAKKLKRFGHGPAEKPKKRKTTPRRR